MDYGGGAGKLTPDTRHWSWRKSFTPITTSREDEGSRWLTNFASQRDKSKFGFKTGGWNWRRRSRPSRSSTSRRRPRKQRKRPRSQLNSSVRGPHRTQLNSKTCTLLKVKFKLKMSQEPKSWKVNKKQTRVWWISRVKMVFLPWEEIKKNSHKMCNFRDGEKSGRKRLCLSNLDKLLKCAGSVLCRQKVIHKKIRGWIFDLRQSND